MIQLANKLDFWHLEDDATMIYKNGDMGGGFKLEGRDIACKSNSDINALTQNLENLLISLPDGTRVQFFYSLNSQIKEQLSAHKDAQKNNNEFYAPLLKSRIEYLKKREENLDFFTPSIYLFIRYTPAGVKEEGVFKSKKKFESISKEIFESRCEEFNRVLSQVYSALGTLGLSPKKVLKDEWTDLLYKHFNFDRSKKFKTPKIENEELFPKSFVESINLTDIDFCRDYIKIGNLYFKVISLANLPEGLTHAGMIHALTNLPFHFWMSQSVQVLDQPKELEKLQLSRRLASSMANSQKNLADLESESQLNHIEDLLRELIEGSEKVLSFDTSIIIWASSLGELEEKSDEVLKAYRKLNSSEGVIETYASLEGFLKSTPGMCSLFRSKKIKSSNASCLLPIFANEKGSQRAVCLVPNRSMGLYSLDPFCKSMPNWNGLIFGGSGAGKSFSIANLMMMFYGSHPTPKIIWIDNGASSKRLLDVLDGEFIDLNIDSKISLNMFDLAEGQRVPPPAKVKLILAVLESILIDSDQKSLPKRDKSLLEEAIFRVYENNFPKTPKLSDLKDLLEQHNVKSMNNYAQILYSWTKDTPYGRIIDRETNIKLNKDLVTIETKGLDDYADLQNVLLLLFTDFIKTEASKDISRPTLLIIDEAWKLFQTKSGLDFTIEAYRTFRKFNSGIWAISQNYKDFLSDSQIASSILPNTTSLFILRQRKIDWEDFQKTFDFNDAQVRAIKGLEIKKGEYSELYYMQDEKEVVLRMIPDPLTYWICTSDGNDKARIEQKLKEKPKLKLIDALIELSKE